MAYCNTHVYVILYLDLSSQFGIDKSANTWCFHLRECHAGRLFPLFRRIPSLLDHFHPCVPRGQRIRCILIRWTTYDVDVVQRIGCLINGSCGYGILRLVLDQRSCADFFSRKHQEHIRRSEIIGMLLLHITTRTWWAFCTTIFWSFERGLYF